jgi:hypothetical protein
MQRSTSGAAHAATTTSGAAARTASPVPRSGQAAAGAALPRPASPRRAWARAGILAGLAGLAGFFASGALTDVPDSALADNAEYLPLIADKGASVWLFQVLMSVAALGLAVFGAGLRRRLDEQEPVGSLAPTLALVGLLLAAGLCLVGGGISTELYWQLEHASETDPDTVLSNVGILNTMGWVWAGVGLSAGAVAWAGLTHESVGRKLAWFSAVMAGLVALAQLVPLQYLAALPGALWCLVAGIAMARTARTH